MNSSKQYFILIIFLMCCVEVFSLKAIPLTAWGRVYFVLIGWLIWQCIVKKILVKYKDQTFYYEVLLIMIIPFISSISSLMFHEQPIYQSFLAASPSLLALFYFYVRKSIFPIEKIENSIVLLGIVVAIINIVQALTYPDVLFDQVRVHTKAIDDRGGFTRTFIQDPMFTVFAFFFYADKVVHNKINAKSIIMLSICAAGIVFTGTRQVIFASFALLPLYVIFSLKLERVMSTIFISIVLISAFFFIGGDKYFSSLLSLTTKQNVISKDYIRLQEMQFYGFDYMPSSLCYLIGNGEQYFGSNYGFEIAKIEAKGFFRSDIGMIGALNMVGAVFFIPIIGIYYKVYKANLNEIVDRRFYKFFFLYLILTSFTGDNYFINPWTFVLIILLLYNIERITATTKIRVMYTT